MTTPFQRGLGSWTQYRSMFDLAVSDEVDLHFGPRDRSVSYDQVMRDLISLIEDKVRDAQQRGRPYVMFIHGSSTSRRGRRTARSQVRGFMRSKAATPLIERKYCIQHNTVFIAKLRPMPDVTVAPVLLGDPANSSPNNSCGLV